MPDTPDLSVVIPAYNEEAVIEQTLSTIAAYLSSCGTSYEILVVDDGSSDATAQIVEESGEPRIRCIRLEANTGKGAAVRRGLEETAGPRVLITDADLSTPIHCLEALEPELDSAGIVVGSRARRDSLIGDRQSRIRESLGKAFNRLLRLLALTEIEDTQCGFKLLQGEAARRLAQTLTVDGFAYDVELLLNARRLGYRITDVGVVWNHREPSSVPVLGGGLRMVVDACRLRWAVSSPAERLSATAIAVAIALALAMQLVAIHSHSLSGDGSYHLLAGHQALRYGQNTMNLEHPPLAKLLFALPTLLEESVLSPPMVANDLRRGLSHIYRGPDLIRRATIRGRYIALGCFGLPLLVGCYFLGARSGGRRTGVLLALSLALSFSVVGNLTILQTDVAVSLAFVLTVLAADGYARVPGAFASVRLGAVWGLGLSVKFSAALLAPTVVLALALARLRAGERVSRIARDAVILGVVALGVLHASFLAANLDYSADTGRAVIEEYAAGRGTAGGGPIMENARPVLLALERADPLLAQWLTGLLAVRSQNAIGVYPSYAFGAVTSAGRWWYHAVVFLLKVPLVILLAGLAALGHRALRCGEKTAVRFPSTLALLCAMTFLVYVVVAMASNYNLGFRHLLPILPFVFLPIVRAVAISRILGVALVMLLAIESLAMAPLWSSQTNTWWLGAHNPTRFALSHGNMDFGQNLILLERVVRRGNLRSIGVLDPRLKQPILACYIDDARLVRPGDPLPAGWYAVNVIIEQLAPALLRDDVGYVHNLDTLRAAALEWKPLWLEVAAGEDHGYVAGTYHLYRIPRR